MELDPSQLNCQGPGYFLKFKNLIILTVKTNSIVIILFTENRYSGRLPSVPDHLAQLVCLLRRHPLQSDLVSNDDIVLGKTFIIIIITIQVWNIEDGEEVGTITRQWPGFCKQVRLRRWKTVFLASIDIETTKGMPKSL